MTPDRIAILAASLLAVPAVSGCMQTAAVAPPRTVTLAETACLSATAAQVGVPDVTTISATPSEAGTEVLIQVPGGAAPWRCIATNDGTVQQVSYSAEG